MERFKRLASGRAVFSLIRCASVCIDAHCDDTDKDDMFVMIAVTTSLL